MGHQFNRMAFITRFNLVLVWSKIVQILTKKSSKWVRHNQVSWSSFKWHDWSKSYVHVSGGLDLLKFARG